MNTLSIKSNKATRFIIENYYLIVFIVYFSSIYLHFIRTGVTMTVLLAFLLLSSRIQRNGNSYSFVLFVFAIYCAFSIVGYTYNDISIVPYFAEFSNQLLPMMLFFVPIGAIDTEKFFDRAALGIALSLIVGIYFWYSNPQYYVDFVMNIGDAEYDEKINTFGLRFQSIYGSIITGTLCLYLIILASYRLFYCELNLASTILNTVYFIIGIACGIMTQQRSAMVLVMFLIVSPFAVLFFRSSRNSGRKMKKFYTIFVAIMIIVFLVYVIAIIPDYIERYIYRLNEIETGLSDRDDQWKLALDHNPNIITGLGLGSSGHKAQGYSNYLIFDGAYWKIFNEVGIVGFLIFIFPIIGILMKHIKSFPRLYRSYMVVLCVMVQSLASNTLCFMLTLPMFWFALQIINQDSLRVKKTNLNYI